MATSRVLELSAPVVRGHPLCYGLRHWWMGLPHPTGYGGATWLDIAKPGSPPSPTSYPIINAPEWKIAPNGIPYIDFVDAADRCVGPAVTIDEENCTISWYGTHDGGGARSVFRPGIQSTSWLTMANSGSLCIRSGSNQNLTGGTASLVTDRWHACTIAFSSAPLQQGWIDGADAGSLSLSLTTPGGADSYVGSLNDGTTSPYVGGIMCLIVHDRPLSQSEAAELAREMHAGFPTLLNWREPRWHLFAAGGVPLPIYLHHYRQQGFM